MKRNLIFKLIFFIIIVQQSRAFEPAGSRVQGMGGAGVALPSDAATVFWNPSGLFFRDRIALDLTLSFDEFDWPENWGFSYINYSRSAKRGAGFGLYRIEDSSGPEGGDAVASVLSTVYRTPIGLPVGLSLKYINENWADEGRTSYFSCDLGLLMPYGPWLLGACFQSITSPGSRLFPYRVLLGASWGVGQRITVAFQAAASDWDELKDPDQADLRAGLDFRFTGSFSLQGGWTQKQEKEYWTGGLGLQGGGRVRLHFTYHLYTKSDGKDRFFFSYSYYLQ